MESKMTEETTDKVEESPKKSVTHYDIHSTVRSRHTRTQRYAAPAAIRRQQFILDTQQRLIPGRALRVSEEVIRRNAQCLKELEKGGICVVKSLDGRKLDLDSFTLDKPAPAVKPPDPPIDSIANDRKPGENFFAPSLDDAAKTPAVVTGIDMGAGEDKTVETTVETKEDGSKEIVETKEVETAEAAASEETPAPAGDPALSTLQNPDFAPAETTAPQGGKKKRR